MHLSADRSDNPGGWRYWTMVAGLSLNLVSVVSALLCDFADAVLAVVARLFDVQASYVC